MRCTECNKFVSFDDSNEPEVENEDVSDEGVVTADVRIVLTCGDCGTELKEATLNLEGPADVAHEHPIGTEAEFEVESNGGQITTRTEGKGGRPRMFYGAEVDFTVTCACGFSTSLPLSDEVQASSMEELT